MIYSINCKSKKIIALISVFLITTLYSTVFAASAVELSIGSDWGGGFGGNIKITNNTSTKFDSWTVEFDFPHIISSIWNASIDSHSGNHYIIKNVGWNGSLQPGANVSFGFNGSPGNVELKSFTNVKLNGIPINDPDPDPDPVVHTPTANNDTSNTVTNTPITINVLSNDSDPDNDPLSISSITVSPTNGTAVINGSSITYSPNNDFTGNDSFTYKITDNKDGSDTANVIISIKAPVQENAPAKPSVNIQKDWTQGENFSVSWTIWSGENASSWELLEDGIIIHSATIQQGNSQQSDKFTVTDKSYGVYNYQVKLSNAAGSTLSDEKTYTVGGASKITLQDFDTDSQKFQITIDQGITDVTIKVVDTSSPSITLATNNTTVITPSAKNSNTITINALKSGRASLKISDSVSGETRYVGIRVKESNGSLPGLPDYLSVGSVSEDSPADLDFWKDFDTDLTNKRMDMRYIYINGGPVNGWRSWTTVDGFRANSYIRESLKLGMIPFFVYYNIPDGGESYDTDLRHIQDKTYMKSYFADLKFFMDIVEKEAGDELVGMIIEPDFIGYMMQNSGKQPNEIFAEVNTIYEEGLLSTENGDPLFEDNLTGLCKAINYYLNKRKSTCNIQFGWKFNLWSSPRSVGNGICKVTDSEGIVQGRATVIDVAAETADYYNAAGIQASNADFIVLDKYGLEGKFPGKEANWFWNADHWTNYLLYAKTLGDTCNLPVILWQIPVGHMNGTQTADPYNGSFKTMGNTAKEYEGTSPLFFLGDTFDPTLAADFNYLSINEGNDNKISTNGNSVVWKSHMQEAVDAGIISVMFGAGVGDSVDGVGTPPSDDYWWITKSQEYFKNPVPLNTDPIDPVNNPPVANNDSAETEQDIALTINVIANDNDADGDNLTISNVTSASNGSANINGSQITYTPSNGFTGTDSFSYTISDGNGGSDNATVNVTVTNIVIQTYTITASIVSSTGGGTGSYPEYVQPASAEFVYMTGDKVTFNRSAYESIIDNNSWSPTVYPRGWKEISQGGGGSSATGSITPNGETVINKGESQTFTIIADSGSRVKDLQVDGSSVGKLTSYTFSNVASNHSINVEFEEGQPPVNTPPTAIDDSSAVDSGNNITINVLSNDTDGDGDSLTISSITQGSKGNVVLSNNSIIYSANSGSDGTDSFSYTVSDGKGGSDTATVTIEINGTIEPTVLIAKNDSVTTFIDSVTTIDALSNDTGDQVVIDSNTSPSNGTVLINNNKFVYTPQAGFEGNDSFSYTVTDSFGQFATALITITVKAKPQTNSAIIGYWHNWGNTDAPYIRLKDVNSKYNVIDVSFAEPVSTTDMTMKFAPEISSESEFLSDLQIIQSRGVKVLISIGGANAHIRLNTTADRDKFVTSMINIIEQYGFDGLDIDFEGGALSVESSDFTNPTSPLAVNTIDAVKEIVQYFKGQGKDFWVTAAPETAYLQGALTAYGGIWGAYIPLLYALGDDLEYVAPQLYNTGSMMALDNQAYSKGNADFIVAMIECLTKGMTINGKTFKLRADQVAIGLPATPAAAYNNGSYIAPVEVIKALDYLIKGNSFGGSYVLRDPAGYPELRGMMTWSVNWDNTNDGGTTVDEFANSYYDYFNGTGPITNKPPVANDDSVSTGIFTPVTINVISNDTDPNGDSLTITSVTNPTNGTVTKTNTEITYSPNSNFSGNDSFEYTVSDGKGASDTATVTVLVQQNSNTTKGDIYYHLTFPVDIQSNITEKLTLNGENYNDLIMSNYVAGALFGHLMKNDNKFSGVKFNRDYMYGSILAQLLQENLQTSAYVNTSDWINPDQTIREMLLNPGQGGPYQINDYAKRLGGDQKSGGLGLINYSVLQKKLGYKIAAQDDNSQTGNTGPDALADKYFGPMATTYFHYNSLNRLDKINTPSWGPSGEFWADCMTNLEGNLNDNFFDMVINAAYNAGPWSDIIKTYIELGSIVNDSSSETQNRILNINNYTLNDQEYKDALQTNAAIKTTFIIYPRQIRFYLDELYNAPGIQSFHPTSNSVIFELNTLKDIFAKSIGTLGYVNGTNNYVLISYADAANAYNSAKTSLGLNSVSSLDLGNTQDRNKIFDLLETAIGNLANNHNIDFGAVTEVDLDDGTPPVNNPPTAIDDSVSTAKNNTKEITPLVNDTDPDNNTLTISSITQPQSGNASYSGSIITYTPNTGFVGIDSFSYTISDGRGGLDIATINVTVTDGVVQTYTITASIVSSTGGDSGSYPEYVEPAGAEEVYMVGDKVTFNGSAYESILDYNSWSPSVYPAGWKSIPQGGDGGSTTYSGIISPNNEVIVEKGNSQIFTITPDTGSKIKDVKIDGTSAGQVTSYNFTNVAENHTIAVEFEEGQQPDNKKPTVSFTDLTDGQIIRQKALSSISLKINSNDEDGTVTTETITVEGQTFTGSSYNWTPSAFGTFAITATATDNNAATTEKVINITIEQQIGNISPSVSFVNPSNYQTITQENLTPLTIKLNTEDEDGTIASILIEVDGQSFTENNAQWTPSAFGDHQITATVTDDEGATALALITITIVQGTPQISSKQVIGYITQWDAWKASSFGYPTQGVCNQLNVDYSKYTMLNYSFFGVAKDGSLHSGDYRNKQMKATNRDADQDPAGLVHGDVYGSWDYWLLYGDLDLIQYVGENDEALNQRLTDYGFSVEGSSWTNSITGLSGSFPIPLPKVNGDGGLFKLCKENNVKLMASIGGWSMCKHFPEMAADPVKKAKFLADCKKLINMGFDGIDIDWEYPGAEGMNFTGSEIDYHNFTLLMKDIRETIGEDKLITAAFSAVPAKLANLEWTELDKYMNYYNMMTYDLSGGWASVTGHNSGLYGPLSWDTTFKYLTQTLNVNSEKINMGVAFYGRGVETNSTADLGVETNKTIKTFSVDGTLTSAADFTNWLLFEGAPNYSYIVDNSADWEYHWDSVAKVPYKTKGNAFLSYDNEQSVQFKADYVNDNEAGGVIIWQVFGDWDFSEAVAQGGAKLKKYSNVKTPLLDVLNNTFTN